jgi:hypothetical protein
LEQGRLEEGRERPTEALATEIAAAGQLAAEHERARELLKASGEDGPTSGGPRGRS